MITLLFLGILGLPPAETGRIGFQPTAAEAEVPAPFRLTAEEFGYELTPLAQTTRYDVLRLRFDSPIRSPHPVNNLVHGEYFRPTKPGRHPAVVVLHILGADFALSRFMAARLADHGVAALFIRLPYYGERRPGKVDGKDVEFLSEDIESSMEAMRQGICDVRRAASWLAGRSGEVDSARIGVTGISLGGIVSAVAVAVDPLISRGAFLMAGGDLGKILWEMPEAAEFRKQWEEAGRSLEDLKALTDPYDPLTYAERLRGKRILMMGARVDEVVPPACTRALWEKAGRPRIEWFDCGHYSSVGYLIPVIRKTSEFLADPNP